VRGETVEHLRWDYADLLEYFNMTRIYLQTILQELLDLEHLLHDSIDVHYLDSVYERIVVFLKHCSVSCIPKQSKKFFKYWWSQELDCLKAQAIDSNRLWREVGRPRSSPIYVKRNSDKRAYY